MGHKKKICVEQHQEKNEESSQEGKEFNMFNTWKTPSGQKVCDIELNILYLSKHTHLDSE